MTPSRNATDAAGLSLIEVMIAMVILSIGVMAIAGLMATGSRSQVGSRMETTAGHYIDEKFESLRGQTRVSADMSAGDIPPRGTTPSARPARGDAATSSPR